MQLPVELMDRAESNAAEVVDFLAWCRNTGPSVLAAADAFAVRVAREYLDGRLPYVYCYRVMNAIMNLVEEPQFIQASGGVVPEAVKAVYLAFDVGEYNHFGDAPDVDPQRKYTLPILEEVLRGRNGA